MSEKCAYRGVVCTGILMIGELVANVGGTFAIFA